MIVQPTTRDAYDLIHRGMLTLNRVQRTGMRVDVPYLKHQVRVLDRKKEQAELRFRDTEVGKLWKRKYGSEMKLGSDPQLGQVLFKEMGLEAPKETEKGNASVTRSALEELEVPELDVLIEWRKIDKTLGTYVLGILKEQNEGVLQPFFHLGQVITYRGSSSNFNFQNLPVRDVEQGQAVRTAIIPWEGQRILEADYGGLEVRIAACYHEDPVMLKYLTGQGDMHRDAACDLFGLKPDEVAKEVRFYAKNGWVFPQFYGSYFAQCAPNLWRFIDQHKLATVSGVPLKEHMRQSLKVRSFDDFLKHTQGCEDVMWNQRFTVYRDWKKRWIRGYEKTGHIELKTGFRCQGTMAKNDVINYPVQGAAFHCLLWSLIELDAKIRKEKWRTKIIGQIHDSDVNSSQPEETDAFLDALFRISTKDIRQAWPWIIVPLEVEVEATPIDRSWYEKTPVKEIECPKGHKYGRQKSKKDKDVFECLTCSSDIKLAA